MVMRKDEILYFLNLRCYGQTDGARELSWQQWYAESP